MCVAGNADIVSHVIASATAAEESSQHEQHGITHKFKVGQPFLLAQLHQLQAGQCLL